MAKLACLMYCPKGVCITSIPDLRWYLFNKQLAESNKLPPTPGALEEHINRVRLQSRVWCHATVMKQQLFDPLNFGYYKDTDGHILPVTTRFFLPRRPSSSWSEASAIPTAPHKDVHAEGIIYRAQNSACATQNAQTMKTITLEMMAVLMITMIACNLFIIYITYFI